MAYYTEADLRGSLSHSDMTTFGARQSLRKQAKRAGRFDIFLSHAKLDEVLILAAKETLERETQLSVYVDWIDDPQLDRSKVSARTADRIRSRMRECSALVYAISPAATNSKWMPWELGYFDGHKGFERISIMPIIRSSSDSFAGVEYLGLYNTLQKFRSNAGLQRPYSTRPGGLEVKTLEKQVTGSNLYTRIR